METMTAVAITFILTAVSFTLFTLTFDCFRKNTRSTSKVRKK